MATHSWANSERRLAAIARSDRPRAHKARVSLELLRDVRPDWQGTLDCYRTLAGGLQFLPQRGSLVHQVAVAFRRSFGTCPVMQVHVQPRINVGTRATAAITIRPLAHTLSPGRWRPTEDRRPRSQVCPLAVAPQILREYLDQLAQTTI